MLFLTKYLYICDSGIEIPKLFMTILFVLITVSSFVAGIFLIAFIWAVKSGQFDDSYTPSVRALFDDDVIPENPTPEIKDSSNNENE